MRSAAVTAPLRPRRRSASMAPRCRARVTNDPLSGFDGNTAAGRRCRDLYRMAAAEIGGRLAMREQIAVQTWVLLQVAFESGDVTLVTELRHAWRAVQALRKPRRKPRNVKPLGHELAEMIRQRAVP